MNITGESTGKTEEMKMYINEVSKILNMNISSKIDEYRNERKELNRKGREIRDEVNGYVKPVLMGLLGEGETDKRIISRKDVIEIIDNMLFWLDEAEELSNKMLPLEKSKKDEVKKKYEKEYDKIKKMLEKIGFNESVDLGSLTNNVKSVRNLRDIYKERETGVNARRREISEMPGQRLQLKRMKHAIE